MKYPVIKTFRGCEVCQKCLIRWARRVIGKNILFVCNLCYPKIKVLPQAFSTASGFWFPYIKINENLVCVGHGYLHKSSALRFSKKYLEKYFS